MDKLYVCSNYPECNAYVGVIPNTNIPKGTLADSELRNKRIKVHRVFDEIWKNKIMTRNEAYNWMKFQFGLTGDIRKYAKIKQCRNKEFYRKSTRITV